MRRNVTHWTIFLLLLGGLIALGACSDDTTTKDQGAAGDGSTQNPDATGPDMMLGTASVSGEVDRTISTCPPMKGGIGTLCVELRTKCTGASTKVASATVANADMSFPTNKIPFKIEKVPDGTLYLYGLLDDDESGCSTLTTGDIYYVAGCVAVTVTGGKDVTGVTLTLDAKKM
jgi:hypothetical protein